MKGGWTSLTDCTEFSTGFLECTDKRKGLKMQRPKVLIGVMVMVCAMLVASPGLCGDGPGGGNGQGVCRNDGAWLGVSPAWEMMQWTVVYDSDSHWTGPLTLHFIGGDPTFGGNFSTAVAFSDTVGTWVRTGRRTFQYTMITYGLDALGQPVFIAKNSGSSELSQGCNHQEVFDSAISIYDPTQDPFSDDPPAYGCHPDPSVHTAWRMHVDPPCEPPLP